MEENLEITLECGKFPDLFDPIKTVFSKEVTIPILDKVPITKEKQESYFVYIKYTSKIAQLIHQYVTAGILAAIDMDDNVYMVISAAMPDDKIILRLRKFK